MGNRQSGLRFVSGRSADISSEEVQFIIKSIKKLKIIKYQKLYAGHIGEYCCARLLGYDTVSVIRCRYLCVCRFKSPALHLMEIPLYGANIVDS